MINLLDIRGQIIDRVVIVGNPIRTRPAETPLAGFAFIRQDWANMNVIVPLGFLGFAVLLLYAIATEGGAIP